MKIDEQQLGALTAQIKSNQNLIHAVSSDELPAKYDAARERGIPAPLMIAADNSHLAEKADISEHSDDTIRFLARDPYYNAVFKSDEDFDRLDRAFKTGRDLRLIDTARTPQVRYGRVQQEVYGNGEIPFDRRVQLAAAGWEAHPLKKDFYFNSGDPDQKPVYQPVLRDWLLGEQEQKISAAAETAFEQSREWLEYASPFEEGDGYLRHATEFEQAGRNIAASEDAKRKLRAIAYMQYKDSQWQQHAAEAGDGYLVRLLADASNAIGEDFSNLSPDALRKADLGQADLSAVADLFGFFSVLDAWGGHAARERYAAGAMSKGEAARYERRQWEKLLADELGSTFAKQAVESVAQSVPFMTEIYLTGGLASIGRGLTGKLGSKGILGKIFSGFAEEVTRLPAFAGHVGAEAMREYNAVGILRDDASGELRLDLSREDNIALGDALVKHTVLQYMANSSERFGGLLPSPRGLLPARFAHLPDDLKGKLGAAFGNFLAKKLPAEKLYGFASGVNQYRKAAQFHGFIGEYAEEEVNQFGNFLATEIGKAFGISALSSISAEMPLLGEEERLLTLTSIGIQSGMLNAPGAAYRMTQLRRTAKVSDKMRELYRVLHPVDGEAPPSRAMAQDVIEAVIGTEYRITVPARTLALHFQQRPELADALNFSVAERDLLASRSADNADLSLSGNQLLLLDRQEDFDTVLNLALDIPGGVAISQVTPETIREIALPDYQESGVALIQEQLASEEEFAGEAAKAERLMREEQRKALEFETGRIADELRTAGRPDAEIKANMTLLKAVTRNLAADSGLAPAELLREIRVKQTDYAAFAAAFTAQDETPFQAAAAALRREGAPNSADKKGQLRDGNVPYVSGFMERNGIRGTRLYADYEFLFGRHPEYFRDVESVRAAVEFVLDEPTPAGVMGRNPSFVRRDLTTGQIFRLEISSGKSAKFSQIRSIHEISETQYQKLEVGEAPANAPSPVLQPSHNHVRQADESLTSWKARTVSDFLRYDNAKESDVKLQSENSSKKGAYDVSSGTIYLFESADRSTFAHETMHHFWSMLSRLDADGLLSGELKADYENLIAFSTDEPGNFDAERLPKAWEHYLMGGRAPNAALQGVFAKFRSWLTAIYRTVRGYFDAAPLSPEVQAIFDRWLRSEELADRELAGNELLAAERAFQLSGLGGKDRAGLLPSAQRARTQLIDTFEQDRAAALAQAKRTARQSAAEAMKQIKVYRLYDYFREQGKLDGTAVKAAFGKDVLGELRRKNAIAKRPRAARPGEEFRDPKGRRERASYLRNYAEAYDSWLFNQHNIVWLIRANHYGTIAPDARFGVLKEQCGSFMGGAGIASDVAARELSAIAGYEITEAELVEALTDTGNGELRRRFAAEYRADKAYWEAEAEQALHLQAGNALAAVALDNDYESAAAMVEDLRNSPTPREFVAAAEEAATDEFESNYPSSEAALAAETQLTRLDTMIAALRTKLDIDQARLSGTEFREAARRRIQSMSVREAERSDLYAGGVKRNLMEAAKAFGREDYRSALNSVLAARVQCEVLRQMHGVQKEIAKITVRVERKAKAPKSSGKYRVAGDVHYFYRDLARKYGFTKDEMRKVQVPATSLTKLLEEYDFDLTPADLPAEGSYKDWTVEEFDRVTEFMSALHRFGADLVSNAEENRFRIREREKAELLTSLASLPDAAQNKSDGGLLNQAAWTASGMNGSFRNLLHLCRIVDGGVNISGEGRGGAMERLVYDRLHRAYGVESAAVEQTMANLAPHLAYFSKRMREFPEYLTGLPELPESMRRFRTEHWTPEMALSFVLNWGNANNRRKLLEGYGWTEEQGAAVLSLFDRSADWTAFQGVWDALDGMYGALDAAFYGANYHHAYKEPGQPFTVTADGLSMNVRGGYLPLCYDGTLAHGKFGSDGVEISVGGQRRVPSPESGMVRDRRESTGLPVLLSLGGLTEHVKRSAHYAALKLPARDLMGMLDDADVQRELKAKLGGSYSSFRRLITNAVNPEKPEYGAFLNTLRSAAVANGLWFNFGSAAKQLSTFAAGMEASGGWAEYLPAMATFHAAPFRSIREVNELSPFMRDRFRGKDRDIREELGVVSRSRSRSVVKSIREMGFLPIKVMDSAAVYPMWLAAHRHALSNGMTADEAVLVADKLIADTQGAGRALDLSAVQLNKAASFLMMFSGPSVALWNRNASTLRYAGKNGWGRTFRAMLNNVAIPAVMTYAISALMGAELFDLWDDDDKKREKSLMKLFAEFGSVGVMGVPVLRDFPDLVFGNGTFSGRSPLMSAIDPLARACRELKGGELSPATWKLLEGAAALYRIPLPTVYRRLEKIATRYSETD